MSLIVNLRHLEKKALRLTGELPVEALDLGVRDELIQCERPLAYDFAVELIERSLLLRGRLELPLRCQCVRCLADFELRLRLPAWTCHIPLQGEEAAAVVSDCVDLTPFLREDILLEFPQHPLCKPGCRGIHHSKSGKASKSGAEWTAKDPSTWAELDKLKL